MADINKLNINDINKLDNDNIKINNITDSSKNNRYDISTPTETNSLVFNLKKSLNIFMHNLKANTPFLPVSSNEIPPSEYPIKNKKFSKYYNSARPNAKTNIINSLINKENYDKSRNIDSSLIINKNMFSDDEDKKLKKNGSMIIMDSNFSIKEMNLEKSNIINNNENKTLYKGNINDYNNIYLRNNAKKLNEMNNNENNLNSNEKSLNGSDNNLIYKNKLIKNSVLNKYYMNQNSDNINSNINNNEKNSAFSNRQSKEKKLKIENNVIYNTVNNNGDEEKVDINKLKKRIENISVKKLYFNDNLEIKDKNFMNDNNKNNLTVNNIKSNNSLLQEVKNLKKLNLDLNKKNLEYLKIINNLKKENNLLKTTNSNIIKEKNNIIQKYNSILKNNKDYYMKIISNLKSQINKNTSNKEHDINIDEIYDLRKENQTLEVENNKLKFKMEVFNDCVYYVNELLKNYSTNEDEGMDENKKYIFFKLKNIMEQIKKNNLQNLNMSYDDLNIE